MSNNHIFIGLGGTGGNIIREFRKNVHVRKLEVDSLQSENGLNLNYLYIDSNDQELNTEWTALGRNVSLPRNQRKSIYATSVTQLIDQARSHRAILPWIGEKEFVEQMISGQGGVPGANQRRRFGRLLFASNAAALLNDIKHEIYTQEHESGNRGVNIHILGSLGGGTGSGSIVDMAMMLRNAYSEVGAESDYPINIYVLVTDNPGAADVGHFKQNEYAALRDINFLMVRPNGSFELLSDSFGRRYEGSNPINQCYVITDRTEGGGSVLKMDQERTLADWLFQIITTTARNNSVEFNTVYKNFSGEDLLAVNAGEPAVNASRSYRFGSVGLMRWSSPEFQLKEYAAHVLAKSVVTGILYNNYQRGEGYVEMLNLKNKEAFFQRYPVNKMELTVDQVSKEDEITDGQGYERMYLGLCSLIVDSPDSTKNRQGTATQIENTLSRYDDQSFGRSQGMKPYFRHLQQKSNLENRVRDDLKEKILSPLQECLMEGKIGIKDACEILAELCNNLRDKISNLDISGTDSIEQGEADCNSQKVKAEKAKIAFLKSFLGKKEKLQAFSKEMAKYHAMNARNHGRKYALEYLVKMCGSLEKVRENVASHAEAISNIIFELKNEEFSLHSKLRDLEKVGNNLHVCDNSKFEAFIQGATRETESSLQEYKRERFVSTYSFKSDYSGGSRWLDGDMDPIAHTISKEKKSWGNEFREKYETVERVQLCPGILETLKNQLGGDHNKLIRYCNDFMKGADVLIRIDHSAPQPSVINARTQPPMPKKSIMIEIPKSPGSNPSIEEFRKSLSQELKNSVNNVPAQNVYVIDSDEKNSEIVVTVSVNYMAARFMPVVTNLYNAYQESISGEGKSSLANRYFANLDDRHENVCSLLIEKGDFEKYKLIMKLARLVGVVRDHDGRSKLCTTNNDGLPVMVDLGPSQDENIAPDEIATVSDKVVTELKIDTKRREVVIEWYKKQLRAMADEFGPDVVIHRQYEELLREYNSVLKLCEEIWP